MEFKKRLLPSPLELSEHTSVRGGVFSPLVPQPRALVITYQTGKGEGQVRLPLEQFWTLLQGLQGNSRHANKDGRRPCSLDLVVPVRVPRGGRGDGGEMVGTGAKGEILPRGKAF